MSSDNHNNNQAQLREQRHFEIRSLMLNENQLETAIEQFQKTINELGPHLGLQCDIAACLYELGRYEECWTQVQIIARDYLENEDLLSKNTKRRTALILSKFFEEMAEASATLEWLDRAQINCESEEEKKWILANELRILSYFKCKADLTSKYYKVLELYNSAVNLKTEILHSLMWAEWSLFGIAHATQRWFELMQMSLNQMDQRLINRDYLEMSLLVMIDKNDPNFIQAHSYLEKLDSNGFDLALLKICSSPLKDLVKESFSQYQLSRMMRFRLLLILFRQVAGDPNAQVELVNKFKFLQNYMDKKSKLIFKNIEPQIETSNQWILKMNLATKTISCKELNLNSKLTRLQILLLKRMGFETTVNLDMMSQQLWQCPSDESIYHRLRMLVYKINQKLSFHKEIELLEIRKDQISLNPKIKIEVL